MTHKSFPLSLTHSVIPQYTFTGYPCDSDQATTSWHANFYLQCLKSFLLNVRYTSQFIFRELALYTTYYLFSLLLSFILYYNCHQHISTLVNFILIIYRLHLHQFNRSLILNPQMITTPCSLHKKRLVLLKLSWTRRTAKISSLHLRITHHTQTQTTPN